MNKYKLLLSLGILTVVAFSLIVVIQSASGQSTDISETKTASLPPLYIATTRNYTINNNNNFILDTAQLINYTFDKFNKTCPLETAIYIHGFNRDQTEAGEEFNRIQMSLNRSNYEIPLIGFSWNSNTDYQKAKNNAQDNGPQLAKFIIAFKNKCPGTQLRLIAHSLGAAVIESTLVNLDKSQQDLNMTSGNNSRIIKSVHLLGAAINNKLIAKNTPFGNATEHVTDKFYNLYDSQDDGLEVNILLENNVPFGLLGVSLKNATLNYHPLGLVGAQLPPGSLPLNYNEVNVTNEIIPISDADGDGNVEECFENIKPVIGLGDNHCGYIGFRQPFLPSLIDDGAMDVVVTDWINSSKVSPASLATSSD